MQSENWANLVAELTKLKEKARANYGGSFHMPEQQKFLGQIEAYSEAIWLIDRAIRKAEEG